MFLWKPIVPENNSVMNKPTRKHTGRNVSRRHNNRNSAPRKEKLQAAEIDRILELEYADEDPNGIKLAHN